MRRAKPRVVQSPFAQWAASSVGRAPRSQCGGREFEPRAVHQSFSSREAASAASFSRCTASSSDCCARNRMDVDASDFTHDLQRRSPVRTVHCGTARQKMFQDWSSGPSGEFFANHEPTLLFWPKMLDFREISAFFSTTALPCRRVSNQSFPRGFEAVRHVQLVQLLSVRTS